MNTSTHYSVAIFGDLKSLDFYLMKRREKNQYFDIDIKKYLRFVFYEYFFFADKFHRNKKLGIVIYNRRKSNFNIRVNVFLNC